jgi:2-polyprenyl-3-methyl-5-hydroxy-6-metoxy-1,4-benzoquinol methylase
MTWQTLQEHEAHYLPLFRDDYRRKGLEALVKRHVRGRRVLDMRCLTGHLAVDLARAGHEVTALDALAEAVAAANAYGRSRGLTRDIARYWDVNHLTAAIGAAPFDTVLCLDTLQHTDDPDALLPQIRQALIPGGQLIINGPAFPALHGKRDRALGHMRRYSRGQFRALIERHGFAIERLQWWNFTGLPLYWLLEGVLKVEVKESLRHGRRGPVNRMINPLLRVWFETVENHVPFPCGLTFLAVARRVEAGP